jgi:hypothetical protein
MPPVHRQIAVLFCTLFWCRKRRIFSMASLGANVFDFSQRREGGHGRFIWPFALAGDKHVFSDCDQNVSVMPMRGNRT